MNPPMNRQWILSSRPTGMVGPEHFTLQHSKLPVPGKGEMQDESGKTAGWQCGAETLFDSKSNQRGHHSPSVNEEVLSRPVMPRIFRQADPSLDVNLFYRFVDE